MTTPGALGKNLLFVTFCPDHALCCSVFYTPLTYLVLSFFFFDSNANSARLIRNFTQLQSYIAPVTWGTLLFFGVINNPIRYSERAPIPEGHAPPLLTDEHVIRILFTFGLAYFLSFLWFFVKTGVLVREYKRDFSYEELFECMTGYVEVEGGVGGGKRKVARFEV